MKVRLIGGDSHGREVEALYGERIRLVKQRPIGPVEDPPAVSIACEVDEYKIEELRDPHGRRTFVGVPDHWHKADLMDGAQDAGIISRDGKRLEVW